MNYILIIGTFEAVFLILLILGKRKKTLSDLFLVLIFFLYALSVGGTYMEIYNMQHGFPFPGLMNLSWLVLFLHGPALWFYIKALSFREFSFKLKYTLHLVPFLGFLIIHYFNFIHLPVAEKIQLLENDIFKDQVFYKISVLSIGISTISYNIWALKLIHWNKELLVQKFSKIEDLDLSWLKVLVIASLICYSFNVALFNLDLIFHFATYRYLMIITYAFASIYILVLGYFGIRHGNVFLNYVNTLEPGAGNNKKITSDLNGKADKEFITRLISLMEQKQVYLDPDITITHLSNMLHVKVDFLSEVLNAQLHQNFFDFVNRYRLAEFKNQCISKSNSHLSIMGIAYNCGFNSKASFYRIFKKYEGISPSAYINQVS